MDTVLAKCKEPDFIFIIELLNSYFNLAAFDKKNHISALQAYQDNPIDENLKLLSSEIENTARYLGSHDIAYIWRKIFSEESGVSFMEMIEDSHRIICKKYSSKVKFKHGTTSENLKQVTDLLIKETLSKMTPDELRKYFENANIPESKMEQIMDKINEGKTPILLILLGVLGETVFSQFIVTIVMGFIVRLIGKQAAKELIKQLTLKFPWWAEWLGPIAWSITGVWLAVDLMSPANRKILPFVLYLGIVDQRPEKNN